MSTMISVAAATRLERLATKMPNISRQLLAASNATRTLEDAAWYRAGANPSSHQVERVAGAGIGNYEVRLLTPHALDAKRSIGADWTSSKQAMEGAARSIRAYTQGAPS